MLLDHFHPNTNQFNIKQKEDNDFQTLLNFDIDYIRSQSDFGRLCKYM